MVHDRHSEYLESKDTFADTMFGFRPHKPAQDILLQLHHEILETKEHPHNDKIVLALDLKGAFDNVKHAVILKHLRETNCGARTFNYIKHFLTDRLAHIRLQETEYGPFEMGTRGTPQGAVLFPFLFNIAMKNLPAQLVGVDGVQHALYADDIAIWANTGNIAEMEKCLQAAASIVIHYAT
nr:putative nicotine oxidoreductase [Dermacentor andersoni]